MQIDCRDYYEELDGGCCLICQDSEEGCWCDKCKCKECFYYTSPGENDYYFGKREGSCDIATNALIEAAKKRKAISEWAKKDAVDYSRIGLHKDQTTLEE